MFYWKITIETEVYNPGNDDLKDITDVSYHPNNLPNREVEAYEAIAEALKDLDSSQEDEGWLTGYEFNIQTAEVSEHLMRSEKRAAMYPLESETVRDAEVIRQMGRAAK